MHCNFYYVIIYGLYSLPVNDCLSRHGANYVPCNTFFLFFFAMPICSEYQSSAKCHAFLPFLPYCLLKGQKGTVNVVLVFFGFENIC